METPGSSTKIKTEPGVSNSFTAEETFYYDTVGSYESRIKIEPLSEEWEPNEEMNPGGVENETTIRIESVSGAIENNKVADFGGLKTEEVDISDLDCEEDSEGNSTLPDNKPQYRSENATLYDSKGLYRRSLDTNNYQCASCLANFPNKRCLGKHVTDICFRNLSPRSKREFKRRLATEDKVQITSLDRLRRSKTKRCLKCRQTFESHVDLKMHKVEFHPKLLNHRCEVCGKAFAKNSYKQRHMQIHTVAGRIYKCDACNIIFTQSRELKSHLKIVHPEKRPYKCQHCDKSFFRSCHRSRHSNIHTQKINYACEICDSKFTQGSNLKSHMMIHADIRRYDCDVCGKKFRQRSDHKKHMLIHTGERPHNCRTCEKPFQTISSRNHHERIHSGERNYACEVCSRTFLSNCHRKRHMITHKKEKKCKIVTRSRRIKIEEAERGSESDSWEPINGGRTFDREQTNRMIVTRGRIKRAADVVLSCDEGEMLQGGESSRIEGNSETKPNLDEISVKTESSSSHELNAAIDILPKQEISEAKLDSEIKKLPKIKIEENSDIVQ